MKGLRAILAAVYSARTAVNSQTEDAREFGAGDIGDVALDLPEDFRQRLLEISDRAEALMTSISELQDEDRDLLKEILECSRRMQWLTDTLTGFHPLFRTSWAHEATDVRTETAPDLPLSATPRIRGGAACHQAPPAYWGDSAKHASWDEIEPLLAQEATTDLMGATLCGDRIAMHHALDTLAALAPGGNPHEVLVSFVRDLVAVAGCLYRAEPEHLETAIDVIEQLAPEALEGYAHSFAWLAYTAGFRGCDTTVN